MILNSIGRKIIVVVSIIVTASLMVTMFFNLRQQENATLEQNERDMAKITESVSQALQTLMLAGYADIAQDFGKRLAEIEQIDEFRILRTNGLEAFQDNKTINRVNEVVGEEEFIPRETASEHLILPQDNSYLVKAVQSKKVTHFYETGADGQRQLVFIHPIENQEDCQECHGDDHEIRGVIYLTSSLTHVYEGIKETQVYSLILFSITILAIVVFTSLLVRRAITRPVKMVTDAMTFASEGDLSQNVPVFGQDEISTMAQSFNRMIEKLLVSHKGLESEHNKLSTIILSTREGVVATNSQGEVVLVNPAAEHLLGKSAQEIIEGGFYNLLDNPEVIKENLSTDISTEITWLDNIISLYASTIYDDEGVAVGSAALLREVTAERKMEHELRRLSITDELTGLYNRRYLDTLLNDEISRAARYNVPLSILFFDIDHFKKFNDQHGHDQGDRVLQAVAKQCLEVLRETDKCCRYGGEEFLVILANTRLDLAFIAAERLRVAIETMRVDGLQVTISVGVSEFPNHNPVNIDTFTASADKALYAAKDGGRNQTHIAQ